jgi:hypothetical protein
MEEVLNHHWELLAEPLQTVMKKNGMTNAYELIKQGEQGQKSGPRELPGTGQKGRIATCGRSTVTGPDPASVYRERPGHCRRNVRQIKRSPVDLHLVFTIGASKLSRV